jgi:hypothetical protein
MGFDRVICDVTRGLTRCEEWVCGSRETGSPYGETGILGYSGRIATTHPLLLFAPPSQGGAGARHGRAGTARRRHRCSRGTSWPSQSRARFPSRWRTETLAASAKSQPKCELLGVCLNTLSNCPQGRSGASARVRKEVRYGPRTGLNANPHQHTGQKPGQR